MKAWKRIAITTSAVVIVAGAGMALRTAKMAGSFDEVAAKPLPCRAIAGVTGAEDMQVDARDRLLIASATDRRRMGDGRGDGKVSGADGIYALALDRPDAGFVRLAGAPSVFHPHGISLFRAADGSLTLMAVNHLTPDHHAVDIFQVLVENGTARLNEVGAIEGDKLIHPNDVVAVGEAQFYVTNDHGSRTDLGMTLENYLTLPRADVLYYDGTTFREAAAGLVFANGINVSNDGRHVYVAESTMRRVQSFARNVFSGRLTPEATLDMPAGPDNIDVASDGTLWIAGHPKMFDLVAYSSDPSKPSPTEIFKAPAKGGVPQPAEPVYVDLGPALGAGSVGVTAGRDLYIGSIFDPKVLRCRLP
ncbi:MAG: SMP-30/gluconolactonase/LRE family protein [Alphaproteobacteria bacterium]|nr:SMP-30/gluconolactonase/LRE family protein [Alphaproteobacteria bacterium]